MDLSAAAATSARAAKKRDTLVARLEGDPEIAAQVETWINEKRSPGTRLQYVNGLAMFLDWLGHNDLRSVDRQSTARYLAWLRDTPNARTGQPRMAATIESRIACISSLFNHLLLEEVIHRDPIGRTTRPAGPDVGKTPARRPEEIRRMMEAGAAVGVREHLLVLLLYVSAARVSEITGADVDDLGVEEEFRVLRATMKGGKPRLIPLPRSLHDLLDQYIEGRERGPLFLDDKGKRMNREQVATILRRLARAAGLDRPDEMRPHVLRTSAITALLDDGVPLADVQHLVGHGGPNTTLRYWRQTRARERNAQIAEGLAAGC